MTTHTLHHNNEWMNGQREKNIENQFPNSTVCFFWWIFFGFWIWNCRGLWKARVECNPKKEEEIYSILNLNSVEKQATSIHISFCCIRYSNFKFQMFHRLLHRLRYFSSSNVDVKRFRRLERWTFLDLIWFAIAVMHSIALHYIYRYWEIEKEKINLWSTERERERAQVPKACMPYSEWWWWLVHTRAYLLFWVFFFKLMSGPFSNAFSFPFWLNRQSQSTNMGDMAFSWFSISDWLETKALLHASNLWL